MISQITGQVQQVAENSLTVSVSGLSYEVFIPTAVMRTLEPKVAKNGPISLITYHYYQTDPSKSIPILIGFENRLEREFFERFITVSGVGPKAALKALSQPLPAIAAAIDEGDVSYLKSLPGIGEQRAREIIAKLQGKMGRFGLMKAVDTDGAVGARPVSAIPLNIQEECLEILLQLQYKKEEAQRMIQKAFARKPGLASAEEVLNEVYRQSKVSGQEPGASGQETADSGQESAGRSQRTGVRRSK